MSLSISTVEHVAELARLTLSEEEKARFAVQLSSIIQYVEKLNSLRTEGIEPLSHILPVVNVFRDDLVLPSSPQEKMMANGPLVEDGQYKVPKII